VIEIEDTYSWGFFLYCFILLKQDNNRNSIFTRIKNTSYCAKYGDLKLSSLHSSIATSYIFPKIVRYQPVLNSFSIFPFFFKLFRHSYLVFSSLFRFVGSGNIALTWWIAPQNKSKRHTILRWHYHGKKLSWQQKNKKILVYNQHNDTQILCLYGHTTY
jgi:hypothetical protein